jgi:hypothetical protein
MAYEEWRRSARGAKAEEEAGAAEHHRQELAQEGLNWGVTRARVIERLRVRIQRDEGYLGRRKRRGTHTFTDDAIASDLRVFALAIAYLEERIHDEGSGALPLPHPRSSGGCSQGHVDDESRPPGRRGQLRPARNP